MVASHGIEVVADAVMKGVQGINSTLAFEASYAASNGQDSASAPLPPPSLRGADPCAVSHRVAVPSRLLFRARPVHEIWVRLP